MDGVYQSGIFKKLRNLLNNKSISIINTLQRVGTVTSAPSRSHQKRVFLFLLLCKDSVAERFSACKGCSALLSTQVGTETCSKEDQKVLHSPAARLARKDSIAQ